jgi:hypothetical protein
MGPILKRENLMSWSSAKFLAAKSKPPASQLPYRAVEPDIGWFNGMYFSRPVMLWSDVTMSKEGPSVEETQDMGGGWCPRRDQA